MAIKKSQPKPPVKKYTAQDSINYRSMVNRQDADLKKSFESFPKVNKPVQERISRRQDSIFNSPYFKGKAKVAVKNGVTTRTLKEAKLTKPAPAKPIAKAKSKAVATKKPVMKSTKK